MASWHEQRNVRRRRTDRHPISASAVLMAVAAFTLYVYLLHSWMGW